MAGTTYYLNPLSLIVQWLTNLGVIAAGGQVNTYVAGTVSTPVTTYTDSTGLVANANPMTLSSAGRPAGAAGQAVEFWAPAGTVIKAVVTDAAGNELFRLDNLAGINDPSGAASLQTLLASPAAGSGVDLVANAVKSYDLLSSLRAAPAPVLASGQTLVVELEGLAALADGLGGSYYWNSTSTAADDGFLTIRPTAVLLASPGRFIRMLLPATSPPNTQNGAYTFTALDAGRPILFAGGSATQWNLPTNAAVPYALGTILECVNSGTANLTISALGLTFYPYSSGVTSGGSQQIVPSQSCRFMKIGTDTWMALDPGTLNFTGTVFTATLGGVTAVITGNVTYKIVGNRVSLILTTTAITGTSNATSFSFSGLPAVIQPNARRIVPAILQDNGVVTGGWARIDNASGIVTFGLGAADNESGFTNVGTKGLPLGFQLVYDL